MVFTKVTDETFNQEVKQETKTVLAYFWAEWCAPCEDLNEVLTEIFPLFSEKLKIAKINIEENQKTVKAYSVLGIPSLLIFKGGEVKAVKVGSLSKDEIVEFINQFV